MTAPRNDGLPELPERYGPMGDAENGWIDGYTADQMRAYGEACRRASPSVVCPFGHRACQGPSGAYQCISCLRGKSPPEPLLSQGGQAVSNGSVTVGGVRVPGPMELNEANLLRYGADYLDGWNSYDEHLRLNHAAEVEEVDALEELSESDKDIAIAQAVEFAEYVERQAKGAMVDAAKRFLSLPYSQEIQGRLAGSGKEN